MAYTVAFTTNQVLGNPAGIVISDQSMGSDVTAISRQVGLVTAQGQWLTANGLFDTATYTDWPLADGASITINALTEDMALYVTLRYVTVSGAVANGATLTKLQGYPLFNNSFYYTLTQSQSDDPSIIQDTNYYSNKGKLADYIDSGDQAVSYIDITTAQNCYSAATFMVQNQNDFF